MDRVEVSHRKEDEDRWNPPSEGRCGRESGKSEVSLGEEEPHRDALGDNEGCPSRFPDDCQASEVVIHQNLPRNGEDDDETL